MLAHLREICALLWPDPAQVALGTAPAWRRGARHASPEGPVHSEFVIVPSHRHPRLLVPASPRLAAVALRHYGKPASRTGRLGARALSVGLAGGLGGTAFGATVRVTGPPGADTIESYLREAISPDIRVSVHLGVPRANRKPVLQLLTGHGETIGFAKVGVNELTKTLVRAERASLARLGGAKLSEITVPRVLHHGEWRGLDVLVLSALPVWLRRRPTTADRLAACMVEVARVDGVRTERLAGGRYAALLHDRLKAADEGPERAALLDALATLYARAGETVITCGSWHGDWTRWNMADTDQGLFVWDWERFTGGVPVGFDALHYWLQQQVGPGRQDPTTAAFDCLEYAPALAGPFGVDAVGARLTATLYLIDVATRYLVDRQAKAGAPRHARATWLVPAVSAEVARL